MKQRKGGARVLRGKHFARVRVGKGRRLTIPLPGVRGEHAAEVRAAEIADVANTLVAAGRWFDVEEVARAMGGATTEKQLRILRVAAERLAASGPGVGEGDETFEHFAGRWTTGALHREHPDHVPLKDATGDSGILALHINPHVGALPLVSFTIENADAVMRALPDGLSKARRRHVAQVIHRVLRLAAYPARLIERSPLPPGWLPKLGPDKARVYLYPDEDAKLMAATGDNGVELQARVLYGFLAREGLRVSEALSLSWSDLDLDRGAIIMDENKTEDPRSWALDPGVVRALSTWKLQAPAEGPFASVSARHAAGRLRDDLAAAGVDRAELYRQSAARRRIGVHDLRATFVTISLATGKTEAWVQDRTGHRSTLMIAKYRRASRTVAELGLGGLMPLDEAIPEFASSGAQVGRGSAPVGVLSGSTPALKNSAGSPSRARTGTLLRARDFKAARDVAGVASPAGIGAAGDEGERGREAAPHVAPHPIGRAAVGLAHLRAASAVTFDVFEVLVAEEAGIRIPKRRVRK